MWRGDQIHNQSLIHLLGFRSKLIHVIGLRRLRCLQPHDIYYFESRFEYLNRSVTITIRLIFPPDLVMSYIVTELMGYPLVLDNGMLVLGPSN